MNLLSRILGLFVETRQISFRPELYSLREFMNLSTLAASLRFTVKRSACKRYKHDELSRRSLTSTEPRNRGKRLKRCWIFLRIAFLLLNQVRYVRRERIFDLSYYIIFTFSFYLFQLDSYSYSNKTTIDFIDR